MMKPLLIAALAIVGLTFSTESAQAGRRCCRNRCCFSACNTCNTCNSCATGCNACANGCSASGAYQAAPVTDPNTAPPPPQTTMNGTGYQSYSYEPGTAVINTPTSSVRIAPQAIQSTPSSFQFRGDRKALGVVF